MTLAELLDHTRNNVLRDTALPSLWSDSELKRYLADAEAIFARRTHAIMDSTSSFATFDTVAGTSCYTLDARIIHVAELGIVTDDGNGNLSYQPLGDRTRKQQLFTLREGRPCTYTMQGQAQKVRFAPVPDDVYTIQMVIARKPSTRMTADGDTPEIAEEFQLHLCDYAAWQALANNDPEGANMVASKTFMDKWDLAVRDAKRYYAKMRNGEAPQARGNWTGKVRGGYYR